MHNYALRIHTLFDQGVASSSDQGVRHGLGSHDRKGQPDASEASRNSFIDSTQEDPGGAPCTSLALNGPLLASVG